MACSRKSGVESMSTVLPPYSIRTEGRVRRSWGSEEWHTAQSHPMVGTPIEVPLPSTVSVAFIVSWLRHSRPEPAADGPEHWSLLRKPYEVRTGNFVGSFPRRRLDCP